MCALRTNLFVEMGMPSIQDAKTIEDAAAFVRRERQKRGWTAQDLADRLMEASAAVGDEMTLSQQAISFFETGKTKSFPRWLRHIDLVLVGHDIAERPGTLPMPANDDGTVEIAKVDLALGMGATFLDDEFVPVEKVRISESLLRVYTDAPPEMLAIVDGIGDSMNPTIQDGDKVLIDMSQRVPMMHDRIWAMAFAGMGMIKRLRARPDGTMLLLSDNPSVPDDRATDGELHIIGRVAGVLRKL